MNKTSWEEPHLKTLTSNWVVFPLLLILGFGAGFISAGYDWVKRGYELQPSEIIVKPPPANATICFPDMGFAGALRFQKELAERMKMGDLHQYNDSIIQNTIQVCLRAGENQFSLQSLHVSPTRFQVVANSTGGFSPYEKYTLITESGCYYLHPIPKRRSDDYDSLIQLRAKQHAVL